MQTKTFCIAMNSIIGTREEQQDCAFFSANQQEAMAIVCDGMGGLSSGKQTSTFVLEKFKELYLNRATKNVSEFLLQSVDVLDELAYNQRDISGERINSGTTLVSVIIEENKVHWLSVGDSRLYILRGKEFLQITQDHNYFNKFKNVQNRDDIAEQQNAIGKFNDEALTSFIGIGGIEAMNLNQKPFILMPQDTLLLATDGLYKSLSKEEISRCLQTSTSKCSVINIFETIKDKQLRFQDNTTCVVIKYQTGVQNENN